MKAFLNSSRLSILTVLAGLTYAFLVVCSFVDGWEDMKRGFSEGENNAKTESSNNDSKIKFGRTYYLNLEPKSGFSSYPDSLFNEIGNRSVNLCQQEIIVFGPVDKPTALAKWYNVFSNLVMLVVSITYFIIPFHFFRFMSLVKNNMIFEKENIKLLRWLGFELLVVYSGHVLFNFFECKINASLFSFSEYKIVMRSMDVIWLLFGVVVLLFAAILSKAQELKEENELTI